MPRSEHSGGDNTSVYSFTTEDTATSEELARRGPKRYKWHKKFAYQKLNGWRPILAARNAELFFLAAGALLIALGVPILVASLNVVEYRVPYAFEGPFAGLAPDQRQQLLWAAGDAGVQHSVEVIIDKRMEPPIYVSYELGSFFQNFRRYVRSYDPQRMHDGADAASPATACNPFAYLDGDTALPINPCGQIANSFFNDTFALYAAGLGEGAAAAAGGPGAALELDESGIAWASDRDHLYGDVPAVNYNSLPPLRGGNTSTLNLNQNEHWMVWMRPHSQVAATKLYGRLDTTLEAGTRLTIAITNRYNTYEFSGAKSVIVSTNSWVGGRNNFLGILYLAVGGLCLLTALYFILGYDLGLIWKRPYGDLANVSWLRQHAAELHAQQQFAAASSNGGGGGAVQVLAYQEDDAATATDGTEVGAAGSAGASAPPLQPPQQQPQQRGGSPPKN